MHILHNATPTIINALPKNAYSKTWHDESCQSSTLIRKTERNFRTRVAKMRARRAKAVAEAAQVNATILCKKNSPPLRRLKIGGGFNLYGSEGPGTPNNNNPQEQVSVVRKRPSSALSEHQEQVSVVRKRPSSALSEHGRDGSDVYEHGQSPQLLDESLAWTNQQPDESLCGRNLDDSARARSLASHISSE